MMPGGLAWRRAWLARHGYAGLAALLLLFLAVASLIFTPGQFGAQAIWVTIGTAAPTILAAIAVTPSILSGRGGLDLSVGPLMGVLNVLLVQYLIGAAGQSSPFVVVPAALLLGGLAGLLNGALVGVVRLQPVVATLGTYLMFSGLAIWLLPSPGGTVPAWLMGLSGDGVLIPLAVVAAGWALLKTTPYYEQLMAIGGDERAAFTSGVPVVTVRVLAYVLGGLLAGVAALSLSAVLGSADPTVGPGFTLSAITAAALGGTSLAGGRGGLTGAVVGALDIFLLQNLLTHFNISTFALQIFYGAILVLAVMSNAARAKTPWQRRGGAA
ncbi:MAG: ABC transporter permease [Thermaerobacter sp.]|nr:ABC transporter permease [Thermaerobacter sp.]